MSRIRSLPLLFLFALSLGIGIAVVAPPSATAIDQATCPNLICGVETTCLPDASCYPEPIARYFVYKWKSCVDCQLEKIGCGCW